MSQNVVAIFFSHGVYPYLHVCAQAHVCTCMWRPEVDVGWLPWQLSTFHIDEGPLTRTSLIWLVELTRLFWSSVPFPAPNARITDGLIMMARTYMTAGVWTSPTLPAELSPQLHQSHLSKAILSKFPEFSFLLQWVYFNYTGNMCEMLSSFY